MSNNNTIRSGTQGGGGGVYAEFTPKRNLRRIYTETKFTPNLHRNENYAEFTPKRNLRKLRRIYAETKLRRIYAETKFTPKGNLRKTGVIYETVFSNPRLARNHSAAEIAGFFASPPAKKSLAASDFTVKSEEARSDHGRKSPQPRDFVAAATTGH